MDYTYLFNGEGTSKVGIIGATKGYGYTLLAQIPKVRHMELRVICSRHTEECLEVLKETGFGDKELIVCPDVDAVIIMTSWETHVPLAIKARRCGKRPAMEEIARHLAGRQ